MRNNPLIQTAYIYEKPVEATDSIPFHIFVNNINNINSFVGCWKVKDFSQKLSAKWTWRKLNFCTRNFFLVAISFYLLVVIVLNWIRTHTCIYMFLFNSFIFAWFHFSLTHTQLAHLWMMKFRRWGKENNKKKTHTRSDKRLYIDIALVHS